MPESNDWLILALSLVLIGFSQFRTPQAQWPVATRKRLQAIHSGVGDNGAVVCRYDFVSPLKIDPRLDPNPKSEVP